MGKHSNIHVRYFINALVKRDPRVWVVSCDTEQWEEVHRANLLRRAITVKVIAKHRALSRAGHQLIFIEPSTKATPLQPEAKQAFRPITIPT